MNKKLFFYAKLILLASLGQIMSDLYLPVMPIMQHALNASTHMVQLSIACYIWGFAFSQLVYGPLSDAFGRRIPLIIGLTIAVAGSWVCHSAATIHFLVMGRLLQGCGAGAGLALYRVILRDQFAGHDLLKIFANFAIANVGLMTSAPLLGALIGHYFGWRAAFTFLFYYAIFIWLLVVFFLPETNRNLDKNKIKLGYLKSSLCELFSHVTFLKYCGCMFLSYGGVLVWITISPMLLVKHRQMLPIHYSYVILGIGVIYGVASKISPVLAKRFGRDLMIFLGSVLMSFGSILVFAFAHYQNIWLVIIPVYIFAAGGSQIFGNAVAGALMPFARIAGAAGSLLAFCQVSGGAITSSFVSAHGLSSAYSMGLLMTILSVICCVIAFLIYVKKTEV